MLRSLIARKFNCTFISVTMSHIDYSLWIPRWLNEQFSFTYLEIFQCSYFCVHPSCIYSVNWIVFFPLDSASALRIGVSWKTNMQQKKKTNKNISSYLSWVSFGLFLTFFYFLPFLSNIWEATLLKLIISLHFTWRRRQRRKRK